MSILQRIKRLTVKREQISKQYHMPPVNEVMDNLSDGCLSFALMSFSTALFLFCGRRRDRIKGLLWESDGFLLVYKRLDNGCFQWPRSEMEAKLLTPQQIRWLLEGLKIEQPKAIREGKPGALC